MTYEIRTDDKYRNRVHSEERTFGGKRADFHVYYEKLKPPHKKMFDAVYAKTSDEAAKKVLEGYKNRIKILFIVPLNKDIDIFKNE